MRILLLIGLPVISMVIGDEIDDDWDDREWRFAFPDEDQISANQCQGEKITLRAGEATALKSHSSYGRHAYDDGYRCRWIFKPIDCNLSLVCYMRTRKGSRGCSGGDYLRIMKGGVDGVNFHKKYCGRRTTSLKFSGDETVKMVFKSTRTARKRPDRLDGWTCKVVCLKPSRPSTKPPTTPINFLNELATAQPTSTATITSTKTTDFTSTTTTSTSTTTATSTSTTTTEEPNSCQCGKIPDQVVQRWEKLGRSKLVGRSSRSERIICPHGQSCESMPLPWQVGLTSPGRTKPWCGGTLVNSRYVLSAAHCLEDPRRRKPGKLIVTLGDHDWTVSGEWPDMQIGVEQVILHPQFRQGALFNYDYAIIKLNRPIDFQRYDWIRPVCLPQGSRDYVNSTGTVSGWGVTDPDTKRQSTVLQSIEVDIMSNRDCVKGYNSKDITPNMICARAPGADACYGDSGGPLTVQERGRAVLAGVVSWGLECARPQWPGVYSRVTSVMDWVRQNTRQAEFCSDSAAIRMPEPRPGYNNRGDRRAG
jgi:hypothetical protein